MNSKGDRNGENRFMGSQGSSRGFGWWLLYFQGTKSPRNGGWGLEKNEKCAMTVDFNGNLSQIRIIWVGSLNWRNVLIVLTDKERTTPIWAAPSGSSPDKRDKAEGRLSVFCWLGLPTHPWVDLAGYCCCYWFFCRQRLCFQPSIINGGSAALQEPSRYSLLD